MSIFPLSSRPLPKNNLPSLLSLKNPITPLGMLGVASEMIDPFGSDLHDFPIYSLVKTGLLCTLSPLLVWGDEAGVEEDLDDGCGFDEGRFDEELYE